MRRKHKPARPHWERIAERRPNGKNVVVIPGYKFGNVIQTLRVTVRPSKADPGQ